MRILVTNDDGIHAPGLEVMEAIARTISDDVWVVAPETEQSGAGHSLTLHVPLRIREITPRRFAVSGTPTDCVLMAEMVLRKEGDAPFDLVLSGVNRGSNLAEDVTYSGTVAAAMEATLLRIPAIAMSQCYKDDQPIIWDVARQHGPGLVQKLLQVGWEPNELININFPDVAADKVKGIKAVPQGLREVEDRIVHCRDPKGRPYYWIGPGYGAEYGAEGSDLAAAAEGFITVTPLHLDFTHYQALERLKAALG
jgi:5'-nucleotidase